MIFYGGYKMCQISIQIPNEVLLDSHMNQTDASNFARQMVALGYYVRNKISIGYCAEIAGMTEEDFILFLGANHVSIFSFENERELLRDVANA